MSEAEWEDSEEPEENEELDKEEEDDWGNYFVIERPHARDTCYRTFYD